MRVEHGGNVYAAVRESGRRLNGLIDFSASINPLGPSPRAIRAIVSALRLTAHYPDPDCVAVRDALAKRCNLVPEQIVLGNGSIELIHLLPRALSIGCALIIGPTFSEYARAVLMEGGHVIRLDAMRAERYRPPVERAIDRVRKNSAKIDAVFLCNPNSPTGQGVNVEDVLELVGAVSRRGAWAVVDETFVEYCEDRSVVRELNRIPRLVVLRSFTKFYALPGLRIGYLAGREQTIRRIRQWVPPWSVNTVSQVAALASIRDVAYARRSRAFMDRERPRLIENLESLPGVTVYPSEGNFLLVELPHAYRARHVVRRLRRQGLLVRDCSSVESLTARTIRIAVRTATQNHRLITTLRHLLT